MPKQIALFSVLHPASLDAKNRILTLVSTSKSYYRTSTAQCTTWTYLTPSAQLNKFSDLISSDERGTLLASIEIYTDPAALSVQLESTMYRDFQAVVSTEGLYRAPEEIMAWYPVAGFVARGETAGPFGTGKGVLVLMAVLRAREGRAGDLVRVLRKYAEWVKDNEPEFLTYSIMTRPKAPAEVLVFERCLGPDAFHKHVGTSTFKEAMKDASQFIKSGKGQEWDELDNAFVGNVVGGCESGSRSKL